jgi:hypothetical protein
LSSDIEIGQDNLAERRAKAFGRCRRGMARSGVPGRRQLAPELVAHPQQEQSARQQQAHDLEQHCRHGGKGEPH